MKITKEIGITKKMTSLVIAIIAIAVLSLFSFVDICVALNEDHPTNEDHPGVSKTPAYYKNPFYYQNLSKKRSGDDIGGNNHQAAPKSRESGEQNTGREVSKLLPNNKNPNNKNIGKEVNKFISMLKDISRGVNKVNKVISNKGVNKAISNKVNKVITNRAIYNYVLPVPPVPDLDNIRQESLGSRLSAKENIPSLKEVSAIKKVSYKEFHGDGVYNVSNGDIVHLDNGMAVKILHITHGELASVSVQNNVWLFADFYFNGNKVNTVPVWIEIKAIPPYNSWTGYEYLDFGVGISLPYGNQAGNFCSVEGYPLMQHFQLSFFSPESLGNIESVEELFDHCIENMQESGKKDCFRYVPYTAVGAETKLANNKVSIIGPAGDGETLQYYFNQANACYNLIKDKLGIEPLFKPLPVRLYAFGANAVAGPHIGVLIPYKTVSQSTPYGECSNAILLHEMTHYFVSPIPLNQIYDEGLATYMQYEIYSLKQIDLIEEDVEINYMYPIYYYMGPIGYKIVSFTWHPSAGTYTVDIDYGITINGAWQSFNVMSFNNFNDADESSTYLTDPLSPIIHMKNTSLLFTEQKVIVDLYSHENLFAPLSLHQIPRCLENGYQDATGWTTNTGKILYAATSINPVNAFMPVNMYLSEGYPFEQYSSKFYSTSMCLWSKIFEEANLKGIMLEMRKYQTLNNEYFPLWDYLGEKGVNVQELSEKYSFNVNEAQKKPYMLPVSGNVGLY